MTEDLKSNLEAVKEEAKSALATRLTSPFLGAFSISWLLWNHRLIFVLFSDLTVGDRFHYIDERLYPTAISFMAMNFAGPLLSALAYIFLLPYPTELVHRWNLGRKQRLRNEELLSEGRRLLTSEESQQCRAEVGDLKNLLNKKRIELLRANTRISALSMTSLSRLDGEDVPLAYKAYLISQPFIIESPNVRTGTRIHFRPDGSAEIDNYPGNIQWFYSESKVQLIDANDGAGKMGFIIYNSKINSFDGNLSTFGLVRIKGYYHSKDFAL